MDPEIQKLIEEEFGKAQKQADSIFEKKRPEVTPESINIGNKFVVDLLDNINFSSDQIKKMPLYERMKLVTVREYNLFSLGLFFSPECVTISCLRYFYDYCFLDLQFINTYATYCRLRFKNEPSDVKFEVTSALWFSFYYLSAHLEFIDSKVLRESLPTSEWGFADAIEPDAYHKVEHVLNDKKDGFTISLYVRQ